MGTQPHLPSEHKELSPNTLENNFSVFEFVRRKEKEMCGGKSIVFLALVVCLVYAEAEQGNNAKRMKSDIDTLESLQALKNLGRLKASHEEDHASVGRETRGPCKYCKYCKHCPCSHHPACKHCGKCWLCKFCWG